MAKVEGDVGSFAMALVLKKSDLSVEAWAPKAVGLVDTVMCSSSLLQFKKCYCSSADPEAFRPITSGATNDSKEYTKSLLAELVFLWMCQLPNTALHCS